ncbi:hypothetical protein [Paenibacillus paeoniae]|uniref:YtkA-like domain-containing protein n=1 Tax=Paenibacillus paeoniae TaxID=2292705 RepID=A0A371P5L8_9BACL|nr:hypothetical protein [Paenibacillus paeoniae]REK71199.1 hypothetical protein DX130_22400 [Paenibacillus paeoniae]
MKYVFLIVLLLSLTACTTMNDPVEEDLVEENFTTSIAVVDTTLKANKDITLITELTNLSKQSISILHGAPLIHVQIYDEQNNPLIDSFITATIGITHPLKPNKPYKSGSQKDGKTTIKIEKAGTYKLIGTASFSIELDDGNRKDFRISSQPVEITVSE